jgi:hypothetical protein
MADRCDAAGDRRTRDASRSPGHFNVRRCDFSMMMGGFITLSQMGLPVKVIVLNKMERLALLNWR